jgi:hypothetical protein
VDVDLARAQLVGRTLGTPDLSRCSVVGPLHDDETNCDLNDIFLLRRIVSGIPGAIPGNVCQAYRP